MQRKIPEHRLRHNTTQSTAILTTRTARNVGRNAAEVSGEPREIEKGRRGGWRPGAGRKKGSKTKVEVVLDRHINEVIDSARKNGEDITALQVFQRIYKSKKIPSAIRMKAASIALPFEAPKLAATELTGANGGPIEHHISAAKASLAKKLGRVRELIDRQGATDIQPDTGTPDAGGGSSASV